MIEGDGGEGPAAPAIPDDVPCAGCGYNLRGLTVDGACPECGHDRGASVDAEIARQATHRPIDGAWARQVVEGLYSLLFSFALTVGVVFLAIWHVSNVMFDRYSPGRYVILAILAAAWVGGGYGVWKMTRAEPGRPLRPWPRRWIYLARWSRTAYLLVPFVWAVEVWERNRSSPLAASLCFFAGATSQAAVASLLCILALRVGRRWLAAESALFLVVAVSIFGLSGSFPFPSLRDTAHSSLDLLVKIPSLPLGSAEGLAELWSILRWPSLTVSRSFWLAMNLVPLWAVAILGRLLFAYRAAARTGHVVAPAAVTPPAAGELGSTPSSSRP